MDGVVNLLSTGGMVLTNNVPCSIPIYTSVAYTAPKKVIWEHEGSFFTFLWGKYQGKPKKRWKLWGTMEKPLEEGG